ncbi:MAG: hypothetical protein LAT62_11155 [Natronospirillum sp.]|uniref:hypothetical protein n=1 Tax=Natronospirillum sp. TaxID=2812955 RepID=UPI0025D4B380|nr:hypothetical protein [Natronospirillum sp.]MCH8552487.1 hypothetical protein [Natronospirillum sp.]
MVIRWFLNGLLLVVILLLLTLAGLYWWSTQPPDIRLAGAETRKLELDNGLQVTVVSDPDAPVASLDWSWESGTLEDPNNWPARHQLFSRVLLYGETESGYRHLDTRALRDPMGSVDTRIDRTFTRVNYRSSPSVFADEVQYFSGLLASPALPLEAIAYERGQVIPRDAAYGFLTPAEADGVAAALDSPASLRLDLEAWLSMSNEGVARELAQYATDRLTAPLMAVKLRSPASLDELEALATEAFGDLRGTSAEPTRERRGSRPGWTEARNEPVSVDRDAFPDAPHVRLMFPWQLNAEQRDSAEKLQRWFNRPYEQGPARRLREAGIIDSLNAHHNDDFFVLDIVLPDSNAGDLNVLHATVASFLAQLQNHSDAPAAITRFASGERLASALTLYNLNLDPTLFLQLDLRGSAAASAGPLSEPDLQQALTLELPRSSPQRTEELPGLEPNEYELLGWQPGLLVDSPGATVWHYEDNRFGTRLASAHLRVHYPIGPDEHEQARWRQWAYQQGPGWSDQIIWTDHWAESPAQGLEVTVDAQGITWQYTDRWPEVEPWLYELVQQLEDRSVDLPPVAPEQRAPYRLMRERAGLLSPPPPENLGALRNTVLLTGRIPQEDASSFARWLEAQRPVENLAEVPPRPDTFWRLDGSHRVAELSLSGDRSQVTRVLQIPENDLRQRTLAEWTFPWLEETLTMAVRGEAFSGELAMALEAPLGYPGVAVTLSSQEQDPARVGLYLESFWRELNDAVGSLSQERFAASTRWRAELLRDAAQSMPTLAAFHWDDITEGRQHFNGRLLQARTLEGTNMDGWRFFARQWLFDNSARQLTVFEIGDTWQDDYQDARQMPSGAREW